ncbi:MAG: hypothetical protein A2X64_07265 [Ignavibacteria bacterium GWF2_33_9]|nr:MAG: hypothetical protein A2X64_07265 [Ignavibacteria bacterium GWF2_33_9]
MNIMNYENKMKYSEKITEFIDGELSQEETKELFNHVAENPQLQKELRNAMKLKNMFHQDLLVPPPLAKTHIYGKLNLQKSAVILSFLATFLLQIRRAVMTPVFGSALLAISLFTLGLFITDKNDNSQQKVDPVSVKSQNEQILSQAGTTSNFDLPIVTSEPVEQSNSTTVIHNNANRNSRNNSSIVHTDNLQSANNVQTIVNIQSKSKIPVFTPWNYNPIISSPMNNNDYSLNNISVNRRFQNVPYDISSILENLSISINKTMNSSSVNIGMEPLSNPLLNNYSIAVSYMIDKHNTLSGELGQENFSQKYNGYLNNKYAEIAQVYTAQWYGISYQYNFNNIDLLNGIYPYTKILIGGTNIGPYLKTSLGISYPLTDKISIFGGVESSRLYYQFQNNWFNSDLYGFNYGVKIGF